MKMQTKPNARRFAVLSSYLLIVMASFFAAPSCGQSGTGPDTAKQTDQGITAVKPEQAEENQSSQAMAVQTLSCGRPALLYEKKFGEALSFFKNELAIGEAGLKPTDAELGTGRWSIL
jgi:hypothetical protein